MTCYCIDCSDTPKFSHSEQYRYECYVRHIAGQKGSWIKKYLGKIQEKYGDDEYHKLRNAVLIEREKNA